MDWLGTRRTFLGWSNWILTAGGLAGQAPLAAAVTAHSEGEDYYEKLGVTKIINAAGTYTVLTASTMPPQVEAAVALAAKYYVRLPELQVAAGKYLAQRLRCEGALVCAGAASGLTLGTAACMTVANRDAIHNIPTE